MKNSGTSHRLSALGIFQKIVIVKDAIEIFRDENGIATVNFYVFYGRNTAWRFDSIIGIEYTS